MRRPTPVRASALLLNALVLLSACDSGGGQPAVGGGKGSSGDGGTPAAALTANPNPIQVCDGSGLGVTTLRNGSAAPGATDIRVGSADGKLFATLGRGGTAETGKWVRDGMQFYLVNGSRTLGTVTVGVTRDGCP